MDIAIDLGKWKSYVVMEDNGIPIKEGYVETTKESFTKFFGEVKNPNLIVEASSTLNRIANMFEEYANITVANPAKVRLIAQSVKKTDKIDAHVLMELYKKDYLPRSYLPPKEVRDARDLCKDRALLVKQNVGIKNKIRYHAYCLGIEFKTFSKKRMKELKEIQKLRLLVSQLENTKSTIKEYDTIISQTASANDYAKLVNTIPGIGEYSALVIASEIGDISRFSDEFRLFSYTGLVPRLYQSGNREWRGHITKGDVFLKSVLLECVSIHIRYCPDSPITYAYNQIKMRAGKKKAKVAAAKRLLRVIYWMLKRDEEYHAR